MSDRPLAQLSGRWVGWWVQQNTKGHQAMMLMFREGTISGKGQDQSGRFDVSGEYDEPDVQLTKIYPGWEVRYFGTYGGEMISGRWTITSAGGYDAGVFEIWPEGDRLDVEALMEEKARELIESR
ncbi:MAG: hypothetical protein SFX74_02710 [Fimbriimonadaceae bacterium]|nr:hypothetical protein [Fimbriimonadaceae bacterium]